MTKRKTAFFFTFKGLTNSPTFQYLNFSFRRHFKTSHSFKVTKKIKGRLKLRRISCCFENTGHLTPTKGRSLYETESPPLKVWMRGFIVQSKHFTSKVKMLSSSYLGMFMFHFIQIKSKIKKKSRSRMLTH